MKRIAFAFVMVALLATAFSSCKKSNAATEAYLTIETTPANKSNNLNILGPDFPLKVEITSVMPPSGVKIQVTASPEGSATAFFTASNNTTAPENNYTITGTPDGVTCVVTITVTSLSSPTNVWSGTYRYSKK